MTSADDEIVRFIVTECTLADEHRYEEWDSLWADTGLYWVCGPLDWQDPESGRHQASYIFDNRARIANRVRQLLTNRRLSQVPTSELVRVTSNYRVLPTEDPNRVSCWVNFMLTEFRAGRQRIWSGKTLYGIDRSESGLRLTEKRVVLVDRADALDTFSFLI
jgi:3-phenylpropionate/cinnamic acid dioxygenase small subunit